MNVYGVRKFACCRLQAAFSSCTDIRIRICLIVFVRWMNTGLNTWAYNELSRLVQASYSSRVADLSITFTCVTYM